MDISLSTSKPRLLLQKDLRERSLNSFTRINALAVFPNEVVSNSNSFLHSLFTGSTALRTTATVVLEFFEFIVSYFLILLSIFYFYLFNDYYDCVLSSFILQVAILQNVIF